MPIGKTKNIGDYIQILATRQFYDNIDGYIEKEELIQIIDDLCSKVDRLQEEKENQEEMIKEYYKPISPYEFYGINEDMFH